MAIELVNWLEIPVLNMERARLFYETLFKFKIIDLNINGEIYPCFPNREGKGFSGALVQYPFTKPGKNGPLVYLNSYDQMDKLLERVNEAGGKVIKPKEEIAPGFGFYAHFEDTEGNFLALQGE